MTKTGVPEDLAVAETVAVKQKGANVVFISPRAVQVMARNALCAGMHVYKVTKISRSLHEKCLYTHSVLVGRIAMHWSARAA